MKAVTELFTRKDYERLPEGFPVELVEGFLVKDPSPTYGHQGLVGDLQAALYRVLPRDVVRPGPVDVPIDDHNVFVPDLAVFRVRPPDGEGGTVVPIVVFEVLSPSTAARDREIKASRYLEAGVWEVWLVDGSEGVVEVHRAAGVSVFRGAETAESDVLPQFTLVPNSLFDPPS